MSYFRKRMYSLDIWYSEFIFVNISVWLELSECELRYEPVFASDRCERPRVLWVISAIILH